MRTNLGVVTANDLDRLRFLQLNDADLPVALLTPLLFVLVNTERGPGEPVLHWQTADIVFILVGPVLDLLHKLVVLLCNVVNVSAGSKQSMKAGIRFGNDCMGIEVACWK